MNAHSRSNPSSAPRWPERRGPDGGRRWLPAALACLALLGLISSGAADASLIFVDTAVDEFSSTTSGDAGCSLREAVHAANTNQFYGSCASGQSGEDIIFLPLTIGGEVVVYDLTIAAFGDIPINEELQILGTGAGGRPQIHANGIDRIFDIDENAGTVSLTNLLLRGGDAGSENGGAIRTNAAVSLVLDDVHLWDNSANNGGAIHVSSASDPAATVLDLTDVTFDDNEAAVSGGAIYLAQSSAVTTFSHCSTCSFDGNVAASSGGALVLTGAARITLTDSWVINNESGSASGAIDGASQSLITLNGTTVSFNSNGGSRGDGYRGTGVLILQDATLRDGISISGGTIEATDTLIEQTEMAAIYTFGATVVSLTRVRVADSPTLPTEPSGALRLDGSVTVSDSIFSGNDGALDCFGCQLTIRDSSFVDNLRVDGGARGGAIYASGAAVELEVENSTFSGNSAPEGGAIWLSQGSHYEFRNLTVTGNTAERGGGLFESSANGLPLISNSIVAGNTATIAGADCWGDLASEGWNLIGDADGCGVTATAGDLFGSAVSPIDAGLAPRALVGELPVHGLVDGSPALDTGNPAAVGPAGAACRTQDQVGQSRPFDAGGGAYCDIGAIEETDPPEPFLFRDGFESGDTTGWSSGS